MVLLLYTYGVITPLCFAFILFEIKLYKFRIMSKELVDAALQKSFYLIDTSIYNDFHKHYEFKNKKYLSMNYLQEKNKMRQ